MTGRIMDFCRRALQIVCPQGLDIVELGARDINGSARSLCADAGRYVGVDMDEGAGVDLIADITEPATLQGQEFDLVVCTETLEHLSEWEAAVETIKRLCKPGGWILVTVPGPGYPHHACPLDFWRFTVADLEAMFADLKIVLTEEAGPAEEGPSSMILVQNIRTGVEVCYETISPEPPPSGSGTAPQPLS